MTTASRIETRGREAAGATSKCGRLSPNGKDFVDDDYVVSFMGSRALHYYDRADATLGRVDANVWVSPLSDVGRYGTRSDVVIGTGKAPSVTVSFRKGEPIYGIAVPTDGVYMRQPTIFDAGRSENWLAGGYTAIRNGNTGKVNKVREFTIRGGNPVPKDSVFFEFLPNGSYRPIRRY